MPSLFHFTSDQSKENLMLGGQQHMVAGRLCQYLKAWQLDGLRFLYKHFEKSEACILNDESGLGKAVTVSVFLGAILTNDTTKKCLIIVRDDESIEGWRFHLSVLTHLNVKVIERTSDINYETVFLIKWSTLKDISEITKINFDHIIIDNRGDMLNNKFCTGILLRYYENKISIVISSTDVTADIQLLHILLRLCGRLEKQYADAKTFEDKFQLPKLKEGVCNRIDLEDYFLKREKVIDFCREFRLRRYCHQFDEDLPLVPGDQFKRNLELWRNSQYSESSGSVKLKSSSTEKDIEELFQEYFQVKHERETRNLDLEVQKLIGNMEVDEMDVSDDVVVMSPLMLESESESDNEQNEVQMQLESGSVEEVKESSTNAAKDKEDMPKASRRKSSNPVKKLAREGIHENNMKLSSQKAKKRKNVDSSDHLESEKSGKNIKKAEQEANIKIRGNKRNSEVKEDNKKYKNDPKNVDVSEKGRIVHNESNKNLTKKEKKNKMDNVIDSKDKAVKEKKISTNNEDKELKTISNNSVKQKPTNLERDNQAKSKTISNDKEVNNQKVQKKTTNKIEHEKHKQKDEQKNGKTKHKLSKQTLIQEADKEGNNKESSKQKDKEDDTLESSKKKDNREKLENILKKDLNKKPTASTLLMLEEAKKFLNNKNIGRKSTDKRKESKKANNEEKSIMSSKDDVTPRKKDLIEDLKIISDKSVLSEASKSNANKNVSSEATKTNSNKIDSGGTSKTTKNKSEISEASKITTNKNILTETSNEASKTSNKKSVQHEVCKTASPKNNLGNISKPSPNKKLSIEVTKKDTNKTISASEKSISPDKKVKVTNLKSVDKVKDKHETPKRLRPLQEYTPLGVHGRSTRAMKRQTRTTPTANKYMKVAVAQVDIPKKSPKQNKKTSSTEKKKSSVSEEHLPPMTQPKPPIHIPESVNALDSMQLGQALTPTNSLLTREFIAPPPPKNVDYNFPLMLDKDFSDSECVITSHTNNNDVIVLTGSSTTDTEMEPPKGTIHRRKAIKHPMVTIPRPMFLKAKSPDLFSTCSDVSLPCSQPHNSKSHFDGFKIFGSELRQSSKNSSCLDILERMLEPSNTVVAARKVSKPKEKPINSPKPHCVEDEDAMFEITENGTFSNALRVNSNGEMSPVRNKNIQTPPPGGNPKNRITNYLINNSQHISGANPPSSNLEDVTDLLPKTPNQRKSTTNVGVKRSPKSLSGGISSGKSQTTKLTQWLVKNSVSRPSEAPQKPQATKRRRLDLSFLNDK